MSKKIYIYYTIASQSKAITKQLNLKHHNDGLQGTQYHPVKQVRGIRQHRKTKRFRVVLVFSTTGFKTLELTDNTNKTTMMVSRRQRFVSQLNICMRCIHFLKMLTNWRVCVMHISCKELNYKQTGQRSSIIMQWEDDTAGKTMTKQKLYVINQAHRHDTVRLQNMKSLMVKGISVVINT